MQDDRTIFYAFIYLWLAPIISCIFPRKRNDSNAMKWGILSFIWLLYTATIASCSRDKRRKRWNDLTRKKRCHFGRHNRMLHKMRRLDENLSIMTANCGEFLQTVWFKFDTNASPQWSWTPFATSEIKNGHDIWIDATIMRVPRGVKHRTNTYAHAITVRNTRLCVDIENILLYLGSRAPDPADFLCHTNSLVLLTIDALWSFLSAIDHYS